MIRLLPSLDGFTCHAEIGRGGFGVVYRAGQQALGREVAVKVLPGAGLDEESFAGFARECRALGAVGNHPNIATVYACGVTADGAGYLAMELLEGGTLSDRTAVDPMPWRDVAVAGVALAGALETAHRVSVLHRDIKPENVLFDGLGTPKLLDFGIASVPGGTVSRTQAVSLTLAHAAPEVLSGARGTAASDIYSLGSTLFAAVHGSAAFVREQDETLVPLLARIASQPVPDLRPAGVPDDLCRLLERAMSKDPAERPLSAEAFGVQLAEVVAAHGGPAVVPPVLSPRADGEPALLPVLTPSEPTWGGAAPLATTVAPSRRVRRGLVAAGVVLLAVGAGGGTMLWKGGPSPAAATMPAAPGAISGSSPSVVQSPQAHGTVPSGEQVPADSGQVARTRTPQPLPPVAAEPVVVQVQPPRTSTTAKPRSTASPTPPRSTSPSPPPDAAPPVLAPPVVTPVAPAVPVPVGVHAVRALGGATPATVRVSASWSAGTGGGETARYQLRRTLMSGGAVVTGPVERTTSGTDLSLLVPALRAPSQWYRWQVRAVGSGGRSAWLPLPSSLADLTGVKTPAALALVRAAGLRSRATTTAPPIRTSRGQVRGQSLSPGVYPGGSLLVLSCYGPRRP